MRRFVLAIVACAAALAVSPLAAEPPKLSYVYPIGVAPGEATEVKLYGTELAKANALWSNLPGLAAVPVAKDKQAKDQPAKEQAAGDLFRLTVPADARLGVYALRAATPDGVTNLRLFVVDDLPTVRENNANKTPATAQELTLPVAVEGGCESEAYDFYKFHAVQGQRVSVEVLARRIGSLLDPVIRLLDSTGRELAYSDDEDATGADGRFSHQFAATGDYFVEVRDIRYAGGVQHRYRLRLGDFPLASVPYPLAAPKGSTAKIVVAGPDVAGIAPIEVKTPDVAGGRVPVAAKLPHGQGSAMIALSVSETIEQVEFEPNDKLEAASPIDLAGAINGRLDKPHDRDYFKFDAKKGQRFIFTGRTRSLGSPTDLFLRLFDAAGAKVGEADDSGTDEGSIDYTFPADGTYKLMAEDLLTRGGPDRVYRIEIEAYRPGFTLSLDADTLNAPKGGVASAKLTCVRRDYKGPIRLELEGAADGVKLVRAALGEDKTDLIVSIAVPPEVEQGKWQSLSLVGKAKIGDTEFTAKASTVAALRTSLNGLPNPPSELDGLLALGVGPVFPEFFQLAADTKDKPAVVPYPQLLGTTTFKVKATKLNKFDDVITLAVEGLPPSFAAKAVTIAKGKAEAVIELTGPKALAEGDYPVRVVGSATFQSQTKEVTLADVVLRVVKPVAVTVAPAGKLAAGGKQKVKISVAFEGGAKGAVKLALKGLPKGVTAPAELALAEGKTEIEAEVTAAADVAPGPIELVAVATTKIKDQEVVVESPVATLEVTKK